MLGLMILLDERVRECTGRDVEQPSHPDLLIAEHARKTGSPAMASVGSTAAEDHQHVSASGPVSFPPTSPLSWST